jgi:hypothetical protein
MKIEIPPSRIHLRVHHECKLKTKNEDLDGGFLTQNTLDVFLLVDEFGNPLPKTKSERSTSYRTYHAKKPCLAAIKAYYALIRSTKPKSKLLPEKGIDEIEKHALNVASEEDVKHYMDKVRQARAEPPAIIRLRRPDKNKIYEYIVSYKRVLKPNAHEIKKGITKVSSIN